MFLGQPLARAMNGMTGRRPLTKTQEHLIEQMRDRQAYDAANTTNTIGDSPANAANMVALQPCRVMVSATPAYCRDGLVTRLA
jgi:hypothetical protein